MALKGRYVLGVTALAAVSLWFGAPAASASKIFDKAAKKQLTVYLDDICQWIIAREQAARNGQIKTTETDPLSLRGNLARTLMAGSALIKNGSPYLDEALRWCDGFAGRQQRVATTSGSEGGYWPSSGEGVIDLADSSLAASALATACSYADGGRRRTYQEVLERYARFVIEGAQTVAPAEHQGTGFIVSTGEDTGGIGGGIDQKGMLLRPSSASTAAGTEFLAHIYAISHNKQYLELAVQSLEWLLKNRRPNGEILNRVEGVESEAYPFTTVTYFSEAVQAVAYLVDDNDLAVHMKDDLENTIRQLMRMQGENGLWGEGQDRRGSSGVATLLAWYYLSFKGDESIPQSLDKFWQTLSNPVHSQSFGVLLHPISTAWAGLTTAEAIKPAITFKKL